MPGRLGLVRNSDYAATLDGFLSDFRMKEPRRRFLAILALAVVVFTVYLLATASPWLSAETVGFSGLPLGTLVTWAGIVSLPVATFFGFDEFLGRETRVARTLRALMICMLLLCAGWGIVSYALAGNWAFNFSNRAGSFQGSVLAGEVFWAYTISIVAMTLLASAALIALTRFSNRGGDPSKK